MKPRLILDARQVETIKEMEELLGSMQLGNHLCPTEILVTEDFVQRCFDYTYRVRSSHGYLVSCVEYPGFFWGLPMTLVVK